MITREEEFENKFSVQMIGEHEKLSGFEKIFVNDELMKFVDGFKNTFSEGILVADIHFKKGSHNEGKYRRIPLAYVKIRFSTDKGMFVAHKENWGVCATLNETLDCLNIQIRDALNRRFGKEKVHTIVSERKMAEI